MPKLNSPPKENHDFKRSILLKMLLSACHGDGCVQSHIMQGPEIPEISGVKRCAVQGWSQKADMFQRVSLTPASNIASESHAPETCVKTMHNQINPVRLQEFLNLNTWTSKALAKREIFNLAHQPQYNNDNN